MKQNVIGKSVSENTDEAFRTWSLMRVAGSKNIVLHCEDGEYEANVLTIREDSTLYLQVNCDGLSVPLTEDRSRLVLVSDWDAPLIKPQLEPSATFDKLYKNAKHARQEVERVLAEGGSAVVEHNYNAGGAWNISGINNREKDFNAVASSFAEDLDRYRWSKQVEVKPWRPTFADEGYLNMVGAIHALADAAVNETRRVEIRSAPDSKDWEKADRLGAVKFLLDFMPAHWGTDERLSLVRWRI